MDRTCCFGPHHLDSGVVIRSGDDQEPPSRAGTCLIDSFVAQFRLDSGYRLTDARIKTAGENPRIFSAGAVNAKKTVSQLMVNRTLRPNFN